MDLIKVSFMIYRYFYFFILFSPLLLNIVQANEKIINVGIKSSEPWVMYDVTKEEKEREPKGFSIDLWNRIAADLGLKTQWIYHDSTDALIDNTMNQRVDVGISAITILSEREKNIDFSNSMYELGLQIMISPENQSSNPLITLGKELGKLLSWKVFFWFILMLVVSTHLRLWADRRDVDYAFLPKGYFEGIRETFWWGITMLITWETPKSRGLARTIDLMWHLIGLMALSMLTAVVTAALTSKAITGGIQSERDLPDKTIAAVATDAPRQYLEKIGANIIPVKDLAEGIGLLEKGEVDALVHDGPRLAYLAKQLNERAKMTKVIVLPATFNLQNYGLVFPTRSLWLEKVNRALLNLREPDGLKDSFHKQLREKWIPK